MGSPGSPITGASRLPAGAAASGRTPPDGTRSISDATTPRIFNLTGVLIGLDLAPARASAGVLSALGAAVLAGGDVVARLRGALRGGSRVTLDLGGVRLELLLLDLCRALHG